MSVDKQVTCQGNLIWVYNVFEGDIRRDMKRLYLLSAATVCLFGSIISLSDGVGPSNDSTHGYPRRVKRDGDISKDGFTFDEHVAIVRKHNALRRILSATDMKEIFWDAAIGKVAQDYANRCNFNHNPNRKDLPGIDYSILGENLYLGTGPYTGDGFIQKWYDEETDYTYATTTCAEGAQCGHYTQVVWASTVAVGCGIKFCPTVQGSSLKDANLIVCNYGPAGNYKGEKPYDSGTKCSKCASPMVCEKDLCRKADCGGKTCKNDGVLINDVCECNCTATSYTGSTCSDKGSNGNGVSVLNFPNLIILIITSFLLAAYLTYF